MCPYHHQLQNITIVNHRHPYVAEFDSTAVLAVIVVFILSVAVLQDEVHLLTALKTPATKGAKKAKKHNQAAEEVTREMEAGKDQGDDSDNDTAMAMSEVMTEH